MSGINLLVNGPINGFAGQLALVNGPIDGFVGQLAARRPRVVLPRHLPIGEWLDGHRWMVLSVNLRSTGRKLPSLGVTDRVIVLMTLIG